jgi:hypothetical protein
MTRRAPDVASPPLLSRDRDWLFLLAWTAVAALCVYGPILAIHAACLTGWGFWGIGGVEFLVMVPICAALWIPLSIPFLFFRRAPRVALAVGLSALLFVACFPSVLGASMALRRLGFERAAERARPLVEAVERYVADHGEPPEDLQALVPRYLPALPDRLPPLQIATGAVARDHYGGNEWALWAHVPTGLMNFDKFLYYPNQAYPSYDAFHSGGLERIDRWAYVHE